jgi:hypothetical protein
MKKIFTLLILIFALLPFAACDFGDDTDLGDAYNFKVISADGPFTGFYVVDGGSSKYFNSNTIDGTIFHSFEKNLSSPSSIYIFATGEDTSATSISIYIYADSMLVKDITASQNTDINGNAIKVTTSLSYSFSE